MSRLGCRSSSPSLVAHQLSPTDAGRWPRLSTRVERGSWSTTLRRPWRQSTRWQCSIGRRAGRSPNAASARSAWWRTTLPYMNKSYGVAGDGLFERARGNPLLTPERWPYRINAVMSAAATVRGDAAVLLCRVEDRRGFSHLTIARSRDGISNWVVDDQPFLEPSA